MKNQKYPAIMALFMTAYYITNSIYQSYMSLYYTSIHFSSGRIGTINAAVALASLAGQPLWGICADRISSRRRLISLLALASGGIALIFRMTHRFLPLMLLAGIFAFFYTAIQPMGDSVVLKRLEEGGHPFGPLRLCGCLAFAVSGFFFGRIMRGSDREHLIPLFTSGMCVITAAAAFSLPVSPGGQSNHARRMSFSELIKHRNLLRLLAFMGVVQTTMGYFYTFFSPHFMSLQGADSSLLGMCYLVSAISEIPFLLLSDKLFDRFGAGRLMCTAALSLLIRWCLLAWGKSVPIAMLSQVFHGWGFIVMTVCMAKYISRTVPEELQASGQMLLAIVSFGIARVAGNLGGGLLADVMGRQNVFWICAGLCAISLCVFTPFCLKMPPLNGIDDQAP